MNSVCIITMDGPAGVGKTTVSNLLADKLQIPCLDTGAMFRQMALTLGAAGLTMPETELKNHKFNFSLSGCGKNTRLLCNGRDLGPEIRTEEVGAMASQLAVRPEVRGVLLEAQRDLGRRHSMVAEGRDMGTVVFPNARFKFFLDATSESRARRRLNDLAKLGFKSDMDTLIRQIEERDRQDRERAIAPLIPAKDAVIIDTTNLDAAGVLEALLENIHKAGGAHIEDTCQNS